MTVGELIKQLQHFPPDLIVRDENTGYQIAKLTCEKPEFEIKKVVFLHMDWQGNKEK
ncbi:hypothetical protein HYP99_gp033 [Sinorhizobium phage ort11]|uniref:Uncharacterized protein n=1 Tax=Sinorhizobium phage ort11 TaxID=2599764 RepID=A0A5C2H729_9CAUD|nr:hypothetical protein HYP99_gp033 [Sinorhizobium phage ort11]QEP29831.1 hypothetical protein Smphiort11_033 [Sinorhizobium phage ort11]